MFNNLILWYSDVEQSLVSQQREAILRLMLHCIDHPSPNFSHILLGFDSNKRLNQGNLQVKKYFQFYNFPTQ